MSVAASELYIAHAHLRLANCRSGDGGDDDDQGHLPSATQSDSDRALQRSRVDLEEARRHYFRYRTPNETPKRCHPEDGRFRRSASVQRT